MGGGWPTHIFRVSASLLAISAISFVLIANMPSDPVQLAIRAWNLPATPETIAALRAQWGLDQPLPQRYLGWLADFVRLDWGVSFRTGEPVFGEIARRMPLSFGMGMSALGLAVLVALPLGFFAAVRPRGPVDRASRVLAILAQSVPAFFLGLVFIWILGVQLRLIRPFAQDWSAYALAITLLALPLVGIFSRVYRRALLEASSQPFFRTALSKGLSHRQALWRHAHPHAFFAMLSALRSEAGWVIGGTATMEVLFNLPGISQFLIQSVSARDYFVLQAYVMAIALWMLVLNLSVTALANRLDPRLT